jgi:hypothetical protein
MMGNEMTSKSLAEVRQQCFSHLELRNLPSFRRLEQRSKSTGQGRRRNSDKVTGRGPSTMLQSFPTVKPTPKERETTQ